MSTTSRSPEATEQEGPVIRTSSRSGLADSALGTRNLMTIAALAVVSMILLVPLNYLAPAAEPPEMQCSWAARSWAVARSLPAARHRRAPPRRRDDRGPSHGDHECLHHSDRSRRHRRHPHRRSLRRGAPRPHALPEVDLVVLPDLGDDLRSAQRHHVRLRHERSAGIASASAGVIIAVVSALVGGAITLVLTRLLNRAGVGIDHRATGRA